MASWHARRKVFLVFGPLVAGLVGVALLLFRARRAVEARFPASETRMRPWHDFTPWVELSKVWWHPVWLFENHRLPVFSAAAIGVLQIVWKVALAFGCVGLFTRPSLVAAC